MLSLDDLTGIIAYGIYQQRKREWIQRCRERDGAPPSEQAVRDFSYGFQEITINSLRQEAEGILYKFGSSYAEDQMQEMTGTALNQGVLNEVAEFRRETKSLRDFVGHRTGYTHHIYTHVVGFLAIAGVIGLVTVAANFDTAPWDIVSAVKRIIFGQHSSSPP